MNKNLEQKLYSRFPLFFRDKDLGVSESCMARGIETSDGWYNLIYLMCLGIEERLKLNLAKQYYFLYKMQLMSSFEKYIVFFKEKFSLPYEEMMEKKKDPEYKINWKYYAYSFFSFLHTSTPSYFALTQVKEKFGALRIYHSSSNDDVEKWISLMENFSSIICESCGSPGEIRGGGWIRVLCNDCNKLKTKNN